MHDNAIKVRSQQHFEKLCARNGSVFCRTDFKALAILAKNNSSLNTTCRSTSRDGAISQLANDNRMPSPSYLRWEMTITCGNKSSSSLTPYLSNATRIQSGYRLAKTCKCCGSAGDLYRFTCSSILHSPKVMSEHVKTNPTCVSHNSIG